jgi:hypothetical protein
MGKLFSPPQKGFGILGEEEMDGTRKDTEDTTLVQSEEDMMRTSYSGATVRD